MFRKSILDAILSPEQQEKAKEQISTAFAKAIITTAKIIETANQTRIQIEGEFVHLTDRIERKIADVSKPAASAEQPVQQQASPAAKTPAATSASPKKTRKRAPKKTATPK